MKINIDFQVKVMALLLFALMLPAMAQVVLDSRGPIAWIHSGYYFVGYETGFGGRKLLGTICNALIFNMGGYVGHREFLPLLWGALVASTGLFIALTAWCLSKKPQVGVAMILAYFLGPNNYANFFLKGVFFAYVDGWLYLLYLAVLVIFVVCRRRTWWYYVLLSVVLSMAVLTHHLFCCLLLPSVLVLFVVDSMGRDGVSWQRAVRYGVVCLLMGVLLAAIVFFETMNVDSRTLYDSICARTAPGIFLRSFGFFELVFFTDTLGNIKAQWDIGNLQLHWALFLPNLLLLVPAFLPLVWPWVSAAKRGETRYERLRYGTALCLFVLASVPMFIVAVDYGRWFYAMFFGLFTASAVMVGRGDDAFVTGWERMVETMKRHPYILVLLLVYLASLKAGREDYSPEMDTLRAYLGW